MFRGCDVTKTEDLGSTFDWAVEQFGRFDIAFNNAGISGENLFADDPGLGRASSILISPRSSTRIASLSER